jgi:hypothetical protein
MTNKNTAAKFLYPTAVIFMLVAGNIDAMHNEKSATMRLAEKATFLTVKPIKVNEVKLTTVEGGIDVLVVNGGPGKISIPVNYKFAQDLHEFNSEENESSPIYFSDYKSALSIANAHNEGNRIKLRTIAKDLADQIACVSDIIAVNADNAAKYNDED